jgi:AcrR family transcriptional regulator
VTESTSSARPATTLPLSQGTKSQQERRRRVIAATIALARTGGADAVQMREVSDASGVSLGTVYTYFRSRDNLLYQAMLTWLDQLPVSVTSRDPDHADSPLVEVEKVTRMYLSEPGLLSAYIRSTLTTDRAIIDLRENVDWGRSLDQLPSLHRALGDGDGAAGAARLLNDVFYAATVRWAFGQLDDENVVDQMRNVVTIVLRAARS